MELNIKGASKDEILKKLFLSTLYLSAFTFGGGYVIVTLMKTKFVDQYHWIDDEERLHYASPSDIGFFIHRPKYHLACETITGI